MYVGEWGGGGYGVASKCMCIGSDSVGTWEHGNWVNENLVPNRALFYLVSFCR